VLQLNMWQEKWTTMENLISSENHNHYVKAAIFVFQN